MKGVRELVLSPLPYLVAYRIQDETIEILYIRHGAQDRPA
jgi:plasmid stabilization system protein ParE